jgi:hypothetical protein
MTSGCWLLLVREHVLQGIHLRSEIGDVPLRIINHRKAIADLLQARERLLAICTHGLIEPMRDGIEALIHGAREVGLAACEHIAHGLNTRSGFRLHAGYFGQLRISQFAVSAAQRPDRVQQ